MQVDREDLYKPTAGRHSKYENSNENYMLIDFAKRKENISKHVLSTKTNLQGHVKVLTMF